MGLQNISRNIILDVSKNKYVIIQVKQYDIDTREVISRITNNGKPYLIDSSITPRIKCKKNDGTYVVNDCTVLEDGSVKFEITEQITAASGMHDCELALFDKETNQVLHTMNFVINVDESVFLDSEVSSSNEFIALENALLEVNDAVEAGKELKKLNEEISQDEEIRKTNETTRINNEASRIETENQRDDAENIRENNEVQRIANENIRIENESIRLDNEEIRESNEKTRKTNEEVRENNEVTRQVGYTEMQNTLSDMEDSLTLINKAVNTEKERAITVENTIIKDLEEEIDRATIAEQNLQSSIDTEKSRANTAENTLTTNLNSEISRAKSAEETLTTNLNSHISNTSNPHKVTIEQLGYGNIDNTSDKDKPVSTAQQAAINSALNSANTYTNEQIAGLINSAPTTLDTLGEIADAMVENEDVVKALEVSIGTKANQLDLDEHTDNTTIHITSTERTNWNDANNKKHTHNNKNVLDGITSALTDAWNSAVTHISDTVKHITSDERALWNTVSNKVDKVSGKGLSTNDYTTTEKNKLSGIASGAEVNQNAFSNVVIGSSTISANTKTDSLTLVGSNVTLTPDITNDKVTIGITKDNVISALGYTPEGVGNIEDTKVTNTLNTTTKAYLTGTTSSDTNTGGQIFDTNVYIGNTAGELNSTSYKMAEKISMSYNESTESLDITFV